MALGSGEGSGVRALRGHGEREKRGVSTTSTTRPPVPAAWLPDEARRFISLVEDEVGVPVRVVGVGAERDDYLVWSG